MGTVTILAEILGSMFLIVGASLFNKRSIAEVFRELSASTAITWLAGLVTFVIGVTFVALYDVWSADWTVLITIFGWLMVIKGAYLILFPKSSIKAYRHFASDSMLVVCGVIAIIIGVLLFLLSWTA